MITQEQLIILFKKYYEDPANSRENRIAVHNTAPYTGFSLLNNIATDKKILHVGCGYNLFKDLRPTIIGIDPVNDCADLKLSLQDLNTYTKFDVILALGSIQFGDIENIRSDLRKMTDLLNPNGRIYWRCAPKEDKPFRFEWTRENHYSLSKEFGYTLANIQDESSGMVTPRLYAEWIKN